MDYGSINEVIGLASGAVGLTGKAASTIATIKGLFDNGKAPDAAEALKLVNTLAAELTAANVMNVQLSETLVTLSLQLRREDEFERQKDRYSLFETGQGDFAYKLRDEMAEGQPAHFICAVCLNRDKLFSFLTGMHDFKSCQANTRHTVRFNRTPVPTRPDSGWQI